MKPIIPNGKRSERTPPGRPIRTGASMSMSPANYDWCVEEANRQELSFSRFVDEMITSRRLQIEEERKNGVVVDLRGSFRSIG